MSAILKPAYTYAALVTSVHDGDTFGADLDCGFDLWMRNQKFRLYGLNAPELMNVAPLKGLNPAGRAARDALLEKLTAAPVITKTAWGVPTLYLTVPAPVVVVTILDKSEKYGRWLAKLYVTLPDKTQLYLNQWLVDNGFAVPYLP